MPQPYERIDQEDLPGALARLTQTTAVADRLDPNREEYDYVTDQLLGAASATPRRVKVDIADVETFIKQAGGAIKPGT